MVRCFRRMHPVSRKVEPTAEEMAYGLGFDRRFKAGPARRGLSVGLTLLLLCQERVDLLCQVRDLLRQLLVLQGEISVRLEQLEDLVGFRLRGSLEPAVALLDSIGVH